MHCKRLFKDKFLALPACFLFSAVIGCGSAATPKSSVASEDTEGENERVPLSAEEEKGIVGLVQAIHSESPPEEEEIIRAAERITGAPGITVILCADALMPILENDIDAPLLAVQLVASAAQLIETPEIANTSKSRPGNVSTQPRRRFHDTCGMKPRQILKGTTYLLTRRTTQRMYLLRPSKVVNACIRYCLAIAQKRSGLVVHSVIFMSNHYHIIVTDYEGLVPVFTEELNKQLARSLNRFHGRWENFFSAGDQTSQVALTTETDVLAKTVYALANPTQAMLVSHGGDWPGVRIFRKGGYRAIKPKFFFRSEDEGGKLPDKAELILTPPPIGEQEQLCDGVVMRAASAREKQIRDLAFSEKKTFMGAAAVKAQSIYGSPRMPAPKRGINPRLACRDKWRRIEALSRLKSFAKEYQEKRKAFIAGDTSVIFPAGTYQIARQFGARCEQL